MVNKRRAELAQSFAFFFWRLNDPRDLLFSDKKDKEGNTNQKEDGDKIKDIVVGEQHGLLFNYPVNNMKRFGSCSGPIESFSNKKMC